MVRSFTLYIIWDEGCLFHVDFQLSLQAVFPWLEPFQKQLAMKWWEAINMLETVLSAAIY